MTLEQKSLQQWIGNSQQERDLITLAPLRGMTALLDRDPGDIADGTPLPPLWHWLYFLPHARQSELSEDGHPHRGGFLPPVPLPRRMWAGGRLEFHHQLRAGDEVSRNSVIKRVEVKEGRSGQLAFVCVGHEIASSAGVAIYEEHDIVYREKPAVTATQPAQNSGKPAPTSCDFSRQHLVDPVSLFRYSALTFNGHRIHYDRDYVTRQEGYPGLIVHGPLLATLLVELCREHQPDRRLQKFEYRALHPVIDSQSFTACGRMISSKLTELWIANSENTLCMQATAEFQ